MVLAATHPRLFRTRFKVAVEEVEEILQSVEEGAALNYLRAMSPDYSGSKSIRDGMECLPAGLGSVEGASRAWNLARSENSVKIRFLLDYACEYADYIRSFDMLRGSRPPDTRALRSEDPWTQETLTSELLSAFPEERKLGSVAVEGLFEAYTPGDKSEHKGYLDIRGDVDHTVRFFVWLPSAREHIEALHDARWRSSLGRLESAYPFEIGRELAAAPENHRITVFGRFLRDPMGYPRNWFEVWRYQIGLGSSQQEIFERLSRPVDLSFTGLSMKRLSGLLEDWFDVAVKFNGVSSETLVSCEASNCPMGLMIDTIAHSALEADWYFSADQVVICPRGANPSEQDMKAVLEKLQETKPADAEVVARSTEGASLAGLKIPDDPAGLRVVLRRAADGMDYKLAEQCFQKLSGMARDAEHEELMQQLRARFRLFARLTGRTPVSHLVDASELWKIVYQKPSGDREQRTVILQRSGDVYQVQEAYGASFSVNPQTIKDE